MQRDEDRWMLRNYALFDFELGESIEMSKLHFYLKDVKGNVVLQDSIDHSYFR